MVCHVHTLLPGSELSTIVEGQRLGTVLIMEGTCSRLRFYMRNMNTDMFIYTYTCTYTYMYIYKDMKTYMCVYIYMCVYVCVFVFFCGAVFLSLVGWLVGWLVVVWCGVVWCGVVWCGVVWCGVVWCGVVDMSLSWWSLSLVFSASYGEHIATGKSGAFND